MILTVTLNAAVDKTYTVENFTIDRVHRPSSWRIVAGGKGINVARVYRELGGDALATGYLGGHNGDFVRESMRTEGIKHDMVQTVGESRVCIAILDPVTKTQTELNEVGPAISQEEVDRLRLKFESLVPGMEYAILSGSAPPGVPESMYKELIEIAKHYGVPSVLDTSGQSLVQGLTAVPLMTKPNVHELSAAVGRPIATVEEAADAAREINARGIEIVTVTMGRDGALVSTADSIYRAKPPEIPFVSAVGSGDAFVAAFVYTRVTGGSISDALRLATAAGAANAMTFGAGFCSRDDILRLADEVGVVPL